MRLRAAGWLGPAGALVALALIAATIVLGWQCLEPPGVPGGPPFPNPLPVSYAPPPPPPLPAPPDAALGSGGPAAKGGVDAEDPLAADRAIAVGLLLDSPRSAAVIDRAIEIAEALRRRYGIDSGDVAADREQAARRAQQEVLESLEVSEEALARAAAQLGYSLDPAACGETCENVRRLALLELQRRALERFAEGTNPPAGAPPTPVL